MKALLLALGLLASCAGWTDQDSRDMAFVLLRQPTVTYVIPQAPLKTYTNCTSTVIGSQMYTSCL